MSDLLPGFTPASRPDWHPHVHLVITTCGNRKMATPAPAGRFYMGTFAQKQMRAAKALGADEHAVLSNVHGPMRPDVDVVPGPYDSHWGYPDTAPMDTLRAWATERFNVPPGGVIVCFGARVYAERVMEIWPDARVMWAPAHLPPGIGHQRGLYSQIIRTGHLPKECTTNCWLR